MDVTRDYKKEKVLVDTIPVGYPTGNICSYMWLCQTLTYNIPSSRQQKMLEERSVLAQC